VGQCQAEGYHEYIYQFSEDKYISIDNNDYSDYRTMALDTDLIVFIYQYGGGFLELKHEDIIAFGNGLPKQ